MASAPSDLDRYPSQRLVEELENRKVFTNQTVLDGRALRIVSEEQFRALNTDRAALGVISTIIGIRPDASAASIVQEARHQAYALDARVRRLEEVLGIFAEGDTGRRMDHAIHAVKARLEGLRTPHVAGDPPP